MCYRIWTLPAQENTHVDKNLRSDTNLFAGDICMWSDNGANPTTLFKSTVKERRARKGKSVEYPASTSPKISCKTIQYESSWAYDILKYAIFVITWGRPEEGACITLVPSGFAHETNLRFVPQLKHSVPTWKIHSYNKPYFRSLTVPFWLKRCIAYESFPAGLLAVQTAIGFLDYSEVHFGVFDKLYSPQVVATVYKYTIKNYLTNKRENTHTHEQMACT